MTTPRPWDTSEEGCGMESAANWQAWLTEKLREHAPDMPGVDTWHHTVWPALFAVMCDLVDTERAALARVTAERDKLIEAWPCRDKDTVYYAHGDRWAVSGGWTTFAGGDKSYPTKTAAVRAAAGLDAGEGV